ncbi:2-hydroxyacylsphingosine 1-beta-galactosyltransferase [Hyalella azteca]|nr:2-hydroxyacylsphingosine 1-beta-galactosyltransferase [Hyalella azteca]
MLSDASWLERHPNVTYVDHGANLSSPSDWPMFECVSKPHKFLSFMISVCGEMAMKLFDDPVVMNLYERRKEFDFVVFDFSAFIVMYPFGHEMTFAILSSWTTTNVQSTNFGNLLNPAFVSSTISEYPQPYSTWDRFKNFFETIFFSMIFRYAIPLASENLIHSRFPYLPSLAEVERNASLHFILTDAALDGAIPLLPLQIPLGAIALLPSKPLPLELEDFISGDTPVVYMSLGSLFGRSDLIPYELKNIFYSVFARLPYKIIMKFEEQPATEVPNLLIKKWLPQVDILAHGNVKAFISHGGLNSVYEAVFHGVPIVGLPINVDHTGRIDRLHNDGLGIKLTWDTLTEDALFDAIVEVVSNASYREKMEVKSRQFQDQRESPLDRAIYWTEYVARHAGAPHLQSPAKHLGWVQLLHLDLLALLLVLAYVIFKIFMWIFRNLWQKCAKLCRRFGGKHKKQ